MLKERAQPKDTLTEVQFRMEYHKIRMKENESPRLFFERLAAVEAKFNYKPTEAERLAQVFIGAENKYSTVLTSVEIAKCGKAKLEDFRVQMMSQYRKENVTDKKDDDNIDELALASSSDLECYNCKGRGHMARNCPHPRKKSTHKNNKQRKSRGACWTCDMKGHKQEDCWYLEKNKDKRPANWKPV